MLFFELIHVALGNCDGLSRVPTVKEWSDLYEESIRQAITGVLLAGLERLPKEQRPPQELLLEWIGISEQIRQTNINLTAKCIELQKKLSEAGVRTSILKGQGIAKLYQIGGKKEDVRCNLADLRQSGDIDIYVDCGREEALSLVQGEGIRVKEWDFKHAQLDVWKDVAVEMHYRVEVVLNIWRNTKLQKWFQKHQDAVHGSRFKVQDGEMMTPTVEFNVFYILLHIYRHFLYEGVGMRQIMDYYMVLRAVHGSRLLVHDNVDAVSSFGMERFAKGLMWVMHETLAMPRAWMLWEPDEKEGRFILDEVMTGGNFGHYDQRLTHGGGKWNTVKQVCKHNWHLMSHYPADVVWAPVWFVWHKCWKLKTKALLAIKS